MKRVASNSFGPAPRKDPLSYPGKRPDYSYLFCGDSILPLKFRDWSELKDVIADSSHSAGVLPLEDRYAVVGYGSNACPAQLADKFGSGHVFPVLRGTMKDFDVVYANGFAAYGSIPATLTHSRGTLVDVWVNILDFEQLALMDASEGRGKKYSLIEIPVKVILENGQSLNPVHAYVAMSGPLMAADGRPIRVEDIRAEDASFRGMTQREVLGVLCTKNRPEASTRKDSTSWMPKTGPDLPQGSSGIHGSLVPPGNTPPKLSSVVRTERDGR